jgi:hypothetical protein
LSVPIAKKSWQPSRPYRVQCILCKNRAPGGAPSVNIFARIISPRPRVEPPCCFAKSPRPHHHNKTSTSTREKSGLSTIDVYLSRRRRLSMSCQLSYRCGRSYRFRIICHRDRRHGSRRYHHLRDNSTSRIVSFGLISCATTECPDNVGVDASASDQRAGSVPEDTSQ